MRYAVELPFDFQPVFLCEAYHKCKEYFTVYKLYVLVFLIPSVIVYKVL